MRTRLALLAAPLLTSLALAGCVVGPNYSLPKQAIFNRPSAQGAFVESASPTVSPAPPPPNWWKLYDDPVLNGLVEQALAANTDLRVAVANLEAARASTAVTAGARDPHAGVSAAVSRTELSGEDYLLSAPLPAQTLGDALLSISYEVDVVGRLKRAVEAARADEQASQEALHLARVTVVADVTRAYVQACAAAHQKQVAEDEIDLQARSLAVTERLFYGGRGLRTDVERSRSQLDQLRAAPPTFIAQQRAALYTLASLLGRTPADYPKAAEACRTIPFLARPLPVGDGAALLARRPDVREAERRLAAATARIGVATADLYPRVTLGASGGWSGLASDIGNPATREYSLWSMVTWSIPDRSARARVRLSQAQERAALARFDGAVLSALRETETTMSAYARELDRNAALASSRDAARQASAETADLYRMGRAPYLNDLDARRTLANADAAVAASDAQKALDQVSVFLALGGGWQPSS